MSPKDKDKDGKKIKNICTRRRLHCRKCIHLNKNPNIIEVDRDEEGLWFVGCYTCGFGYDRGGFKTREDAEKSFMERSVWDDND